MVSASVGADDGVEIGEFVAGGAVIVGKLEV